MKLSLVVLTTGKMAGKSIPITLSQFIIGRDPECQLRPASALISKRHCAILVRGGKAFVRDFNSTNGTFVNDERVQGERPLQDGDRVKIGPLDFRVVVATAPTISKPTPMPASSPSGDDEAAAMLLSLQDDGSTPGGGAVDSEGIPTGSTVMERLELAGDSEAPSEQKAEPDASGSGAASRSAAAKSAQGNTSSAAKAILEKYMRRPRG